MRRHRRIRLRGTALRNGIATVAIIAAAAAAMTLLESEAKGPANSALTHSSSEPQPHLAASGAPSAPVAPATAAAAPLTR